jgi:hypothetical protein
MRRLAAASVVTACGLGAVVGIAAGQDDAPRIPPRIETFESGKGDAKRKFCSDVDLASRPIAGGCVLEGSGRVLFRIITPFGRAHFAKCTLRFTAHVRLDGLVAFDDAVVGGENICADIRPCREETDPTYRPWLGQIEPRGKGYRLRVDACFDTCAGWFEGPLTLSLDQGDGMRLRAERAQVGESGLELDGDVRLSGDDLELRTVAPPS